jgi:hypothetical protein
MPAAVLEVLATLTKPPATDNVPVVRFNACPDPFKVTSGVELLPTTSVPKLLPTIFAPVVAPTVNPRRVLPCPSVIALEALVMLTFVVGVTFIAGKGSPPLG